MDLDPNTNKLIVLISQRSMLKIMESDTRWLASAWLLLLLLCHLVLSAPMEHQVNEGSAPEWKRFFVSQRTALVNDSTKLFCKVKGKPRPFIEWFKNGEALADGKRVRITKFALEVMNTQLSDAGEYACRASNQHGVLWGNMTLRVIKDMDDATPPFEYDNNFNTDPFSSVSREPVWSRFKDRATYISGSATKTVELDCDVRGYPEPNIIWYKVDGGKLSLLDLTKSKYVSNNRWKLKIDGLALEDKGQYMCVVANIVGAINWTFTVDVLQRLPLAPIVDWIDNQTAIEGDTVRFTCKIILSDSQPFLQWFQHYKVNDSYVDEKGTPNVKLLQQSGYRKTIDDPQNLVLRNVSRKDEGWYTCLVTNTIGINYKSAYLIVTTEEAAADLPNKNMTASSQFCHGSLMVITTMVIAAQAYQG
ncbi:fibroblast growth factor receptor 3-like isoform X2 [Dreissena polymorpha]|uniref:fibroblast growth factor receptor 3-like isoform X2 n=1 Tax=Dreissena polymorpha TaxID=45954 RepID=UPI002264BD0F|nr:fibroblast growth factor receptor 3-like isoform X2 [Dreissena polymorpha]